MKSSTKRIYPVTRNIAAHCSSDIYPAGVVNPYKSKMSNNSFSPDFDVCDVLLMGAHSLIEKHLTMTTRSQRVPFAT